ncbi:MAG TPA: LapA family protein [candidate division Zixibacteria bacterium]|nr:LapA family protein [candidate division Zixibacteria bacterium]
MWAIRAILIVIMVLVVVAFAYYNLNAAQVVDVDLVWAKYVDVPLITVVFWAFVAGLLVSMFIAISTYIKQSIQLRTYRKRIRALESEVAVLRNRPIEESADLLKGADKKGPDSGPVLSSGD